MRGYIPLWFGTLLLAPGLTSAQEPPLFQVKGYGTHVGDEVVYHYRVINNNPTNVAKPAQAVIVEIGRASLDHDPELASLPPIAYPPVYQSGILDVTVPTGWKWYESGEEDQAPHTVVLETTEISSPYTLMPGQTLTGFSVTRREVNATYLNSHFGIVTNDSRNFSGLIEREDITPPALSVSMRPNVLWPPNEKLIPITATITVKDDYDPQPEVKLESITANEPLEKDDIKDAALGSDDRQFKLRAERDGKDDDKKRNKTQPKPGRIYTITYSALDASGNKSTVSTTVTVPHDRKGKND